MDLQADMVVAEVEALHIVLVPVIHLDYLGAMAAEEVEVITITIGIHAMVWVMVSLGWTLVLEEFP